MPGSPTVPMDVRIEKDRAKAFIIDLSRKALRIVLKA